MDKMKGKKAIAFLAVLLPLACGLPEVCMFYNLHADCYYRIDFFSIAHIRAEVDQCTDPLEVTFRINNEKPNINFEHTFSNADEVVAIHGFDKEVQLHVQLNMKDDVTINIEADFFVGGAHKTDFINSDVKLNGQDESCPFLNIAAQIAMGIMGGLVFMAAILILVLLYVRWRRRKKSLQNTNDLIRNAENPGLSTPTRGSRILEETDIECQQINSTSNGHMNTTSNSINRSENGAVINGAINRSECDTVTNGTINRSNNKHVTTGRTCDIGHVPSISRSIDPESLGAEGCGEVPNQQDGCVSDRNDAKQNFVTGSNQFTQDQKFSDLMHKYDQNQFKISDC